MLDAATKTLGIVKGRTLSDLEDDELRSLALLRLLEIVGEAASQVSDTVKKTNPEISWAEIIGTRNRLIHGYVFVDLGVVWRITTEDLPSLVEGLRPLVSED
jgi:uncharacterized protein with HEPN domain